MLYCTTLCLTINYSSVLYILYILYYRNTDLPGYIVSQVSGRLIIYARAPLGPAAEQPKLLITRTIPG